ncbi:MAG: hypothetical protein CSA66_02605 [Proteobacteria bacterium]|nr:MAG: hypothetical protein CSA66_02605 [Pseudomonadota bacterium]
MAGYVPAHVDIHAPGYREPTAVAFFLHGILGSATNWRAFVRRLVEGHPGWLFVVVDLRNHGDSVGARGPHTLSACAADLANLAADLGLEPSIICGHSFGGKVAMTYAVERQPDVDEVWLLDAPLRGAAGPDPSPAALAGVEQVRDMIATIRSVPVPLARRAELVDLLMRRGTTEPMARWMTTNLKPTPGGYRWRFDLDAVEEMLADYLKTDLLSAVDALPGRARLQVVRGARSDRFDATELSRLEALAGEGSVSLHTLADAGHWLHVDNPEGLAELLRAAMRRVARRLR